LGRAVVGGVLLAVDGVLVVVVDIAVVVACAALVDGLPARNGADFAALEPHAAAIAPATTINRTVRIVRIVCIMPHDRSRGAAPARQEITRIHRLDAGRAPPVPSRRWPGTQ
jgi:hypothetical protein